MMLAWLNMHAGPNELAYDAGLALAISAHASLIHFLCDGFRLASGGGTKEISVASLDQTRCLIFANVQRRQRGN
jgi:hypothetical protein